MTEPLTDGARTFPTALDQDDEAGLVAAAVGRPERFVPLYCRYVERIYRYLLNRTGSVAEAEDLTAQTFVRAIEHLPTYRHRGYFAAWLFAIARNLVRDAYRQRLDEVDLEAAESRPTQDDLLAGVIRREAVGHLRRILRRLPEEERELLRLRYLAGLSFPQMAQVLGQNEERIKKRVYRLLARIERQMEDTV